MSDPKLARLSSPRPGENGRVAHVYMDESNFRISGGFANKKRHGVPSRERLVWKYDIRVLKGIIRKGSGITVDETVFFNVYGSKLQCLKPLYRDLKLHTSEVFNLPRNKKNQEKQVDTSLVKDMTHALDKYSETNASAVFVVISGDSDMIPAVKHAISHGYAVHVWPWERSTSRDYRLLQKSSKWGGLMTLTYLDEFLSALTMRSSSILIRDISIPPDGVVFPNPWQRSPDVLGRIRKDLPDGNIFFIKRSNDGTNYFTDIGILHDSGVLDQDVFLRRILKNLQGEGLHVMSFAEYFRASDELELCAKLGTHLLGCFPNFFWARPLEALRFGNR